MSTSGDKNRYASGKRRIAITSVIKLSSTYRIKLLYSESHAWCCMRGLVEICKLTCHKRAACCVFILSQCWTVKFLFTWIRLKTWTESCWRKKPFGSRIDTDLKSNLSICNENIHFYQLTAEHCVFICRQFNTVTVFLLVTIVYYKNATACSWRTSSLYWLTLKDPPFPPVFNHLG